MPNNLTEPSEERRCTARARRSGWQRCKRAAIAGGDVCPSHGGRAPAVKRRAAERVALAKVRALLGDGRDADPGRVLAASVTAANAILQGAQDAACADDADPTDLRALTDALQVAAKVARLAGDAGLAERFTLQQQRNGELVAALIKRIVEGAGVPDGLQTTLYASLAGELRRLDGFDLDAAAEQHNLVKVKAEIAMIEARIAEHEQVEQARRLVAELPDRLAGGIAAGFAVLDLDEAARERVAQAVEGFLRLEAEATDQQRTATREADIARSSAAWRTIK